MNEQPEQGIQRESNPRPTSALEGTFLTPHKYPGAAAPPTAAPVPVKIEGGRNVLTRVILPLALFVAVVGGLTWVAQYLPNWRRGSAAAPPTKAPIQFPENVAVWDLKDENYAAEFERGSKGHYDFVFDNVSAEPAELGLSRTNCGCSHVEVCLLTAEERKTFEKLRSEDAANRQAQVQPLCQELAKDETKGLLVPAGGSGLVRLHWDVRKSEGSRDEIRAYLWTQAQGKAARFEEAVAATIVVVPVVRFHPERWDVGVLLPRSTESKQFWCWSSTEDQFDLTLLDQADPCLVCQATPLTAEERQQLTREVRPSLGPTRVRTGYRLQVTLHEEKDGKQLDMGYFQRSLPIALKVAGQPAEASVPKIQGSVRSDVRLLAVEEQGKINLKHFKTSDGKTQKVVLATDPNVKLRHLGQQPTYLDVSLGEQGTSPSETTWELNVVVPPDRLTGPLPGDSAIVLEALHDGGTPRRVRIPLLGTAVRD